ncbi:MAG: BspA family leucine-rich repeat surface protein [Flavobacteriaceae bacterium]|nr:BspA family leucine-rich repeat surface protein [Flavobacteriaceae bacterium]MBT3918970.1 BspA family leucine-rich repeat surface protein [Flavobacteriaceae bacterium]MBT6704888.1 BspA family leucine-rich repeat surface protein [Flavobacteriaceae bacterium]MBT7243420.1 BspA family leucine-rich repeat surface protein [Flavobacteriaceae bacterium]
MFLDIGEWNVSSVIYMSKMFYTASAFNQNLSSWSVSYVTCYSRFIKIIHK